MTKEERIHTSSLKIYIHILKKNENIQVYIFLRIYVHSIHTLLLLYALLCILKPRVFHFFFLQMSNNLVGIRARPCLGRLSNQA